MDTLTLPELYPFKLFLFGGFHLTLNDNTYFDNVTLDKREPMWEK